MAEELENGMSLFGFEIKRKKKKEEEAKSPALVPPSDDDGAGYITTASHHYGYYLDLDGATATKNQNQLIKQYRAIAQHPEVDMAIDEIVNEAIVTGDEKSSVELVLNDVELSQSIKDKIIEEFNYIYQLLNFKDNGHDIFRSWYIDGRLAHQLVVKPGAEKEGIKDIRYIDSLKIRKVKRVQYEKKTPMDVKTVKKVDEFFLFEEKPGNNSNAVKISADAINYVTSGILDETKKMVLSHLYKAIKPVNQLRMMEDSLVIYRLARAPERRIFYVDVGNMTKGKAESYMQHVMSKYRNKLVYDAKTGRLRDDRKHMSMLEDFWLPRREGGRGTEVSTLPGGDNLGQIDDILYFQKRLYRSLKVPINRLEQEAPFSLGRSTEITRDEVKFQKFIDRLRNRFAKLFLGILKQQVILKGILTEEDWNEIKDDIYVSFQKDNHFSELKDNEVLRERLDTLQMIEQFENRYFTREWILKNVLHYTDEEIKELEKEKEKAEKEAGADEFGLGAGIPPEAGAGKESPKPSPDEEIKKVVKIPQPAQQSESQVIDDARERDLDRQLTEKLISFLDDE